MVFPLWIEESAQREEMCVPAETMVFFFLWWVVEVIISNLLIFTLGLFWSGWGQLVSSLGRIVVQALFFWLVFTVLVRRMRKPKRFG